MVIAARNTLIEAIKDPEIKVVSFDLFDTLLRRRVADPNHVFWFVAEDFASAIGLPDRTETVFSARLKASVVANHRARLDGREDSTLSEIYDALADILPDHAERIGEMRTLELDVERALLEPYPFGRQLFDAARSEGKRVLIASDQYLPLSFLEERLEDFGYWGHEAFLLSGDTGLLKASGSVYEWMPKRFGVDRHEILHIGDNFRVDVEVARRSGLKALHMPVSAALAGHPGQDTAAARRPSLGSLATASYLNALADDACAPNASTSAPNDALDFLGYSFYGPVLTYLGHWLAEGLRTGQVDRLWLLARDGQGLHQVMTELFPDLASRIDYVYASRRMLVYPTGELSGREIFRHYGALLRSGTTVAEFAQRISNESADFTPIADHFPPETIVQDVRDALQARLDARCAEIRSDIQSDTMQILRAYYRDKAQGAKRIGVFDLGWRGNLQRALEKVLRDEGIALEGYYVGLIHETEIPKSRIEARGFAFTNDFPAAAFEDISRNLWPIELIFGGSEPSAECIRRTDSGWEPVFEADSDARRRTREIAARLQTAALRFARDSQSWPGLPVPRTDTLSRGATLIREFLARPARCDAEALASLAWSMDIVEDMVGLIAEADGRRGKDLSRARAASAWPAGFDAMQSKSNLRRMHRYWNARDRRRRRRDKRRKRPGLLLRLLEIVRGRRDV